MAAGNAGLVLAGADLARARQLFAARGVVVLGPPALDPAVFADLAAEARHQRSVAAWELAGTERQDRVDQRTVRAELGPVATALMAAGSTASTLAEITGQPVRPGWPASCLTYYEQAGQFLGEHTDKRQDCRFAMLVYLQVSRSAEGTARGTGLHVRLAAGAAPLVVTATANRVVVLDGSRLAHWRPPLLAGESVSLLAGCFAAA